MIKRVTHKLIPAAIPLLFFILSCQKEISFEDSTNGGGSTGTSLFTFNGVTGNFAHLL